MKAVAENFSAYEVRPAEFPCVCALCEAGIRPGQAYHDGGGGRRAHAECVQKELQE